jgi:hypothetical protein
MRKILDNILMGGIKNKYFIYHRYTTEPDSKKSFQIYQVQGHNGIVKSTRDLAIDICMYDLKYKTVKRYNTALEPLLENEEATQQEVDLIPSELKSSAQSLPKSKEEPYYSF